MTWFKTHAVSLGIGAIVAVIGLRLAIGSSNGANWAGKLLGLNISPSA